MTRAGVLSWVVAVASFVGVGCTHERPSATKPTEAQLEAANPAGPLPEIPLGLLRTWEELEQPPTPQTVRLGRWLFYDERLSLDNSVACASCHRPEHAFSEPTPNSTGIDGQKGGRKAPTFINAAWAVFPATFWDGRAASLEDQAKGPMTNPIEMGMPDPDLVVSRVGEATQYRKYFKEAFGDEAVTIDRIAKAIADYERTRLSGNSRWDRWQANMTDHDREVIRNLTSPDPFGARGPAEFQDGSHVTAQEKLGHALFLGKAKCLQCHLGPNLTDSMYHNIGVGWDPQTQKFEDVGRYAVTEKDEDRGAFKTPTIREVSKRAPYMHDGSVTTLREVVELYNKGGERNPFLSSKIQPLNLAPEEVEALVAFMRALDGEGYIDQAPALFPH